MREAWRLRVWTRFLAKREEVWRLKTDPVSLSEELRPWLKLSMSADHQSALSSALSSSDGSAQVCARVWPTGMRWDMDVEVIERGFSFRDRSSNSVYQRWEHTHRLIPASDATLYVDDVYFIPALACPRLVASATCRLFKHRHRQSARRLPTEAGSLGVAVLRLDCPAGSG